MNGRFNELALQAGFTSFDKGELQSPFTEDTDIADLLDAFAKLIAGECVRSCIIDIADPRDTVELQCAQKIKKHFGVEE